MIVQAEELSVSAYIVPTDQPESDGTIAWDSTTMVLVQVNAGGHTGIGYTYADMAAALLIHRMLRPIVTGKDVMDIPAITDALIKAIRNNGNTGLCMMAVSAIDTALWDLKAKLLDLPLAALLGAVRSEIPIYGSGGFTSYTDHRLQHQLNDWAAQGIRDVKMKIGRHPDQDVHRVALAREAIGAHVRLYVDANGAYTVKQALEKAEAFTDYNVCWFEEPVVADDLEGLHFVREHAPASVSIVTGEYGYNIADFKAILAAKSTDILQADATRCGGITGFLKAGYLCEAYQLPFSSHCAPALHLHPAMSLSSFTVSEYFHDHVRIEQMFFDGVSPPVNSALQPDLSRPGLGIEFKEKDAAPYKI